MKRRSRVGGKKIKGRRGNAALPRGRNSAKPIAHSTSPVAGDETVVARLSRELNEALEQQTATSEVLRVISSSAGDLEPVFASMLENAVRICDAKFGNIYRWDGEALHLLAAHDTPAALVDVRRRSALRPTALIRHMVATRTVAHVADLSASEDYVERHPAAVAAVELGGVRTALLVPLLKEDELIGSFTIYRQEVRPFTDKQIALVTNFAAQAVIAIENARLLNELRQRTSDLTERTADLTEALEQQTATSEVLQVISSSPGDLQPVFATMLESAARICDANFGNVFRWDGDALHLIATHNTPPAFTQYRKQKPVRPGTTSVVGRTVTTKTVVHIADAAALPAYVDERDPAFVAAVEKLGACKHTWPSRWEGERTDRCVQCVSPRSSSLYRQADRVGQELCCSGSHRHRERAAAERTAPAHHNLTEALEQQTATSDVLEVVSSSPGDLRPVFETMLTNATRICAAKFGVLWLSEGEGFRCVALHNAPPTFADHYRDEPLVNPPPGSGLRRLFETRHVTQVTDMRTIRPYIERDPFVVASVELGGYRSVLNVPMLKEGALIGAIFDFSPGSSSIQRQADRAGHELRRPSGHRHRERAIAQRSAPSHKRPHRTHSRTHGSVRAADGHLRGSSGHQQLSRRSSAGIYDHTGECCAAL